MISHLQRGLMFVFIASVALVAAGCHPHLHKKHFTGGASKTMPVSPGSDEHGAPWKDLDELIITNLDSYEDISLFSGSYDRYIPFDDENNNLASEETLSGHWKIVASRKVDGKLHVNAFVFPNDGEEDKDWGDYWVPLAEFKAITGLTVFEDETDIDENRETCGQCVLKEGVDRISIDPDSDTGRCRWILDIYYCYDSSCRCWEQVAG